MDKKELWDTVAAKRPELIAGKTLETVTDAELETISRMAAEVSLDQIRDILYTALREKNKECWINEIYPSYLIYCDDSDSKYYKIGWSILDGKATLGAEATEVERTWVDARSKQAESDEAIGILARLGAAQNPEGSAWEVTICEPGHTLNGWYIPDEAIRAGAGLFENVDVNLYELPQGAGATHVSDSLFDLKSFLVKNKVGFIDQVKHVAGRGLMGVLHFLDSAKWLGKNLLDAMNGGKAVYGLSYDCPVRATKDVIDGKNVFKVVKFVSADSVDIVTRPAAGGKFNRAVAAVPAHNSEVEMKDKLWKMVQEKRPDLLVGKDLATISEQDVEALARMAMDVQGGGVPDEVKILRCEMSLDRKLTASDLPDVAKERISATFRGRAFEDADLDRAIADEKDYLAKVNTQPAGDPAPASVIIVGLGTFERACMAADRLFGLTKEDVTAMAKLKRLDNKPFFEDVRNVQDLGGYDDVPAFNSIREMYSFFTGDHEVSGRFMKANLPAALRAKMDINSGTFTYVLGNTLARRLVAVYRAIDYLEKLLISVRKPVKDFRLQEAVLVGGFPDISTVDPEAADYQEIAGVTDEESTYTVAQKGNLLTITRKTIINDDISVIQRLIDGFGRAFRRTHAKYVWNFFINNANCSDATAWFTGAGLHGNLGATALSFSTGLIAYKALAKMTEKDSGERIGLLADPSVKPNLIGPIDIMETINQIANEEFYYSANDLTTKTPNPLKNKVNPVVVPILTDENDWGLLLPPELIDMVEMGYLNGREEPEMFIADSPQSEQVFVADKVRYKGRHEYAGAVVDYRSGYKAVVA